MNIFLQFFRSIYLHIKHWDITTYPDYKPFRIKNVRYLKTVNINGIKLLDYNDKLIKTATLLNAIYLSKKNIKMQSMLEESMTHLVTPKYIIPDYSSDYGVININTQDLDYKHLTYAMLPLVNYVNRNDTIALLEDNLMSIMQNMINTRNYILNDPYNSIHRDPDTTNFNPNNINAEKAVTILAALSFGKKFNHKDWQEEFNRLDKKLHYGLLAQLAVTETGHDVFHAAYILYKNTKQIRWKKLMIRAFKSKPSLYPYLVMEKENIIDNNKLYRELAESHFYTKKQNTFNHGVVNVLI
jgi:hypothetical protein